MRPHLSALTLLISLLLTACSNKAAVHIINGSGQKLSSLEIQLAGNKKAVSNLESGAAATIVFRDFSDSHYTLNGTLQDGTKLTGTFGYVTNGMNFDDTFTVKKNGEVEFKSAEY